MIATLLIVAASAVMTAPESVTVPATPKAREAYYQKALDAEKDAELDRIKRRISKLNGKIRAYQDQLSGRNTKTRGRGRRMVRRAGRVSDPKEEIRKARKELKDEQLRRRLIKAGKIIPKPSIESQSMNVGDVGPIVFENRNDYFKVFEIKSESAAVVVLMVEQVKVVNRNGTPIVKPLPSLAVAYVEISGVDTSRMSEGKRVNLDGTYLVTGKKHYEMTEVVQGVPTPKTVSMTTISVFPTDWHN